MATSKMMSPQGEIDYFSKALLQDATAMNRRLAAENPVIKVFEPNLGRDVYIVTSRPLVEETLRAPDRFSSDIGHILFGKVAPSPEVMAIREKGHREIDTLLTSDEPKHSRLRKLVAHAFMPNRVKRMHDFIGKITHELIDEFVEKGVCDVGPEFAAMLPCNAIGAIMGIPAERYQDIYRWVLAFARRAGNLGTLEEKISDELLINDAKDYVARLIAERRANPGDDLLSDLVLARAEDVTPLTDEEILSTAVLLILGGVETTQTMVQSTLANLLSNADQMALCMADPALLGNAFEESMRMNPPSVTVFRVAAVDTDLAGVPIPAGAIVMPRIDSANRDPEQFPDPDRYDVMRKNANRHLSFGLGIHYCIGFRLAKLEVELGLQAMLARLKNLRLDTEASDLSYMPSLHLRCVNRLVIRFDPGERLG